MRPTITLPPLARGPPVATDSSVRRTSRAQAIVDLRREQRIGVVVIVVASTTLWAVVVLVIQAIVG